MIPSLTLRAALRGFNAPCTFVRAWAGMPQQDLQQSCNPLFLKTCGISRVIPVLTHIKDKCLLALSNG
jgi:hypothetical protein